MFNFPHPVVCDKVSARKPGKGEIIMAEQHASVIVNAQVEQVYRLFVHFSDFPKILSFIEEVTYLDSHRSHWIANLDGRHEWDAENRDWVANRQVGWRSIGGLENTGFVRFDPVSPKRTRVTVSLSYDAPRPPLLGARSDSKRLAERLKHDLERFARMVEEAAESSAFDPGSSDFLLRKAPSAREAARFDLDLDEADEEELIGVA
jgi:uncharacterized membrane protein